MTPAAREIGLELLKATSRLDEPLGITWGANRGDYMTLGFAVRCRRLLRGTFLLLDAELAQGVGDP
jgi:hypothetical protein